MYIVHVYHIRVRLLQTAGRVYNIYIIVVEICTVFAINLMWRESILQYAIRYLFFYRHIFPVVLSTFYAICILYIFQLAPKQCRSHLYSLYTRTHLYLLNILRGGAYTQYYYIVYSAKSALYSIYCRRWARARIGEAYSARGREKRTKFTSLRRSPGPL